MTPTHILISAPAMVITSADEPVFGSALSQFDGLGINNYVDEFTQYMSHKYLVLRNYVTEGWAYFEHDGDSLHVVTRYRLLQPLTDVLLKLLVEYTVGQWSDGIGEGFGDEVQYRGGDTYYVNAWWPGQPYPSAQYKTTIEPPTTVLTLQAIVRELIYVLTTRIEPTGDFAGWEDRYGNEIGVYINQLLAEAKRLL